MLGKGEPLEQALGGSNAVTDGFEQPMISAEAIAEAKRRYEESVAREDDSTVVVPGTDTDVPVTVGDLNQALDRHRSRSALPDETVLTDGFGEDGATTVGAVKQALADGRQKFLAADEATRQGLDRRLEVDGIVTQDDIRFAKEAYRYRRTQDGGMPVIND
jgi:hypothetical protein